MLHDATLGSIPEEGAALLNIVEPEEPVMNRWKPSLEGSLAIFNALSMVGLCIIARQWKGPSQLEPIAVIWTLVLALPVGWYFLIPRPGSLTTADIVLGCVMVGVNAIVWGCVVGALLRRTFLSRFDQTAEKGEPPEE